MKRMVAAAWLLPLALVAACSGGDEQAYDPTCCQDIYPVWCARFAECDPLSFSRSWRDASDCAAEQVSACRAGTDTERVCVRRTEAATDLCVRALTDALCDDLFGSAGLPVACLPGD